MLRLLIWVASIVVCIILPHAWDMKKSDILYTYKYQNYTNHGKHAGINEDNPLFVVIVDPHFFPLDILYKNIVYVSGMIRTTKLHLYNISKYNIITS